MGSGAGSGWRGGRNPPWSRAEAVLLLDLYRRVPNAPSGHPEVVALSQLLNRFGRAGGAAQLDSFRNPDGVAMRLRNLGRLDPAHDGRAQGLRPGGAVDRAVWIEFGADKVALAREAAKIRARRMTGAALPSVGQSSHGPPPSFGRTETFRSDSPGFVYVLRLAGPVCAVMPGLPAGADVCKVGRSRDPARRLVELTAGFPPGAAIRWELAAALPTATADVAHRAERALLDESDRRGWSIGGEFVRAALDTVIDAAAKAWSDSIQLSASIGGPSP